MQLYLFIVIKVCFLYVKWKQLNLAHIFDSVLINATMSITHHHTSIGWITFFLACLSSVCEGSSVSSPKIKTFDKSQADTFNPGSHLWYIFFVCFLMLFNTQFKCRQIMPGRKNTVRYMAQFETHVSLCEDFKEDTSALNSLLCLQRCAIVFKHKHRWIVLLIRHVWREL